jgi:hypothetical protein
MTVSQTFCVQREPVGKRITAVIELADDPGGDPAGRQALLTAPGRPPKISASVRLSVRVRRVDGARGAASSAPASAECVGLRSV